MEFVFVVPREELFPHFYPQGWRSFVETQAAFEETKKAGGATRAATIDDQDAIRYGAFEERTRRSGFFVERAYAETRPELKQIIPYGIVTCEDRVLCVRRLKRGGESRLHDKLSIGIGGHINPVDAGTATERESALAQLFQAATKREIEEELTIDGTYTVRSVGLLNDDSNPVGAVHVGLVQWVEVRGSIQIREREQLAGDLTTVAELREQLAAGANFETWSKILVERIDEILPHPVVSLA